MNNTQKRYTFKNGLTVTITKGFDHYDASPDSYYVFIGSHPVPEVECDTLNEAIGYVDARGFGEPSEVESNGAAVLNRIFE